MKAMILAKDWKRLEFMLAELNIGYRVMFDNHNGYVEMLVNVDEISIMRDEIKEEE